MKYIRTKDDIFRIDNDKISVINGCQFVSIRGGILHALDVKDEVADTIEELCDEFVVVVKNNPIIPNKNYIIDDYLTAYQGYKTGNTNELYGAIWTDKGLIYVAKMNDKGELELL